MANNDIDPTMAKDTASTKEMNEVERVMSGEEMSKNHQDYGRMDAEVAKYATGDQVDISEAENKRSVVLHERRLVTFEGTIADLGHLQVEEVHRQTRTHHHGLHLLPPGSRQRHHVFHVNHGPSRGLQYR